MNKLDDKIDQSWADWHKVFFTGVFANDIPNPPVPSFIAGFKAGYAAALKDVRKELEEMMK